MTRAGELAEDLLDSGITAMKIWPFDPAGIENKGMFITTEQMKAAIKPFEQIRKAVGDKMEIMVEMHSLWNLPVAKDIARALEPFNPRWYEDPIRMNSPQALAEFARSTHVWTCASETLGSRFAYKEYMDRDAAHVVMADLCWTGGASPRAARSRRWPIRITARSRRMIASALSALPRRSICRSASPTR